MKKLAAVLMVATLSACATPYGEYGFLGGFTDSRIDESTFSIWFQAPSLLSGDL